MSKVYKVIYLRKDGGRSSQTVTGCSSPSEAVAKVRANATQLWKELISVTEA